jgi:hypothetical protein
MPRKFVTELMKIKLNHLNIMNLGSNLKQVCVKKKKMFRLSYVLCKIMELVIVRLLMQQEMQWLLQVP